MTTYPMALGQALLNLRKRLDVSKYKVALAAPTRLGRTLNHAQIARIEKGERFAAEYDTIERIAVGIDQASERGQLTRGDYLSLYEAAFADRVTYEAAKFAVYYLYVLDGNDAPLHPALEKLRFLILESFPESGEDPEVPHYIEAQGRTGPRGPRSPLHVNLHDAVGFEAVREMAEMHEAHALRLKLLIDVVPWITQDWEASQLRIGHGALLHGAFAKSGGFPRSIQEEQSENGDSHIVQWLRDQIDEAPEDLDRSSAQGR